MLSKENSLFESYLNRHAVLIIINNVQMDPRQDVKSTPKTRGKTLQRITELTNSINQKCNIYMYSSKIRNSNK